MFASVLKFVLRPRGIRCNVRCGVRCGVGTTPAMFVVILIVLGGFATANAQPSEASATAINAITFDHVKFDIEPDGEYDESLLTDEIRALAGQRIRIRGYIRPNLRRRDIQRFVFVRDDKECCFGPGAALYDCMLVQMAPDHAVDFTVRPITLEGEFVVRPLNAGDRTWAVFRIQNARLR